jgi:hypothetical protein
MKIYKNDEFFYVNGDKDITVTITFSDNPDNSDRLLIRNAAEALQFFANSSGVHKAWAKKIEVNR